MKTLNLETLDILGAVLPSIKEIENLTKDQRKYRRCGYWLRSPGYNQNLAARVLNYGSVDYTGIYVDYDVDCVRPALVIENLNSFDLQIGEEVEIDSLSEKFSKYIVLNEHILLANFDISYHAFNKYRSKGNDYWTSDIKEVVDKWFEENFPQQI